MDEVLFSICNILLGYTSSVTRFYCLTQFFNFVVRATFPLRGRLLIITVDSLKPSRKAPRRFTFSSMEKGDRFSTKEKIGG